MTATDGIKTREKLITPRPIDTGSFDAIDDHGQPANKPLGGWEEKAEPKGVFIARPGIYFPMNPTIDDIKEVKGRGLGKGTILDNSQMIVDSWNVHRDLQPVRIKNVDKFCGAKSSISKAHDELGNVIYNRASREKGDLLKNAYGQWVVRPVEMSFNPMPKRESLNPDGLTLKLRSMPKDLLSKPYDRATISKDTLTMMVARQEAIEQPDGDFTDFEDTDE
jgi:hypothetical protein